MTPLPHVACVCLWRVQACVPLHVVTFLDTPPPAVNITCVALMSEDAVGGLTAQHPFGGLLGTGHRWDWKVPAPLPTGCCLSWAWSAQPALWAWGTAVVVPGPRS